MGHTEKFYIEFVDDIADSSRPEKGQEASLEARLYDAFLRFPTLKAKQNAVVYLEGWAKRYDDASPYDS